MTFIINQWSLHGIYIIGLKHLIYAPLKLARFYIIFKARIFNIKPFDFIFNSIFINLDQIL
jgi:hypothetical protein